MGRPKGVPNKKKASGPSMLHFSVDQIMQILAERNEAIEARVQEVADDLKAAAAQAIVDAGKPLNALSKAYGLDVNCLSRLKTGGRGAKVTPGTTIKVLICLGYDVGFRIEKQ